MIDIYLNVCYDIPVKEKLFGGHFHEVYDRE